MHLTDVLLASIVTALLAVSVTELGAGWKERTEAEQVAWQLSTLAEAAKSYVADRREELLKEAKEAGGSAEIDLETLESAGLLSGKMKESNVWGQVFELRVWEDSGRLGLLVAAKGARGESLKAKEDFARTKSLAAARHLAGAGFYMPGAFVRKKLSCKENVLVSPDGVFVADLTEKGMQLEVGSVALIVPDKEYGRDSGLLHRKGDSESGELNTMRTELNMGDNAISDISTLGLTPIAQGVYRYEGKVADSLEELERLCVAHEELEGSIFFDSEQGTFTCRKSGKSGAGSLVQALDSGNSIALKGIGLFDNQGLVAVPLCPSKLVARIYAAPASSGQGGGNAKAMKTEAILLSDKSAWRLEHRILVDGVWTLPESSQTKILAISTCEDPAGTAPRTAE